MNQIRTWGGRSGSPLTGLRQWSGKGVLTLSALAAIALMTGCRLDMHDQPKFIPQRGTAFFADGRSARPQVEHTVARGQLHEDEYFYTGLLNGKEQDAMPFPATLTVLERGQERYNVYCTPCHSRVGNGDGMIVQRGYVYWQLSRCQASRAAVESLLLRYDEWLRGHAGLCGAAYAG